MMKLKEANFDDIEKEWQFVRDMPEDENGLTNDCLEYGRSIIPEDEFYLRVNKDNAASLKVMLKNGGRIVAENEEKYFVRIKK